MGVHEIKEAIGSLMPLPQTMNLIHAVSETTYIDDTFNANPQALLAALSYMKLYKSQDGEGGKRILVLQPMIELGKKAGEEHYKTSKQISLVCDYLLLTNKNYYSQIMQAVTDGGGKCEVRVGNASSFASLILKKTGRHDVVVFEGKEAGITLRKLLKKGKK